jgi:glucosyl-dolichyl phosphate glucuronosyltransferase
MKITVGICTWNRANLLNQTLSRMISLRIPYGVMWELLVVNNNSTDHTESVLKDYVDRLPLRRLFEASPGKSNALNLAVREAQGDLIVWTDDDVLVDPDWLAAYATAAAEWPEAAFFGGPIEPWFDGEPPEWLKQTFSKIETAYAALNLGPQPRLLAEEKLPFGANLAIRTVVQQKYQYNPKLGPMPNSSLRGEETSMLQQMVHDGLEGRWIPTAKVRHFVPRERQKVPYLRQYYHGLGLYMAQATAGKDKAAVLFGYPRWLIKRVIISELRYQIYKTVRPPEKWIEDLIEASVLRGLLEGSSSVGTQRGKNPILFPTPSDPYIR